MADSVMPAAFIGHGSPMNASITIATPRPANEIERTPSRPPRSRPSAGTLAGRAPRADPRGALQRRAPGAARARSSPPPRPSPTRPAGDAPSSPASPRTAASSSSRTASWPGRSRTNARSRRPPSGWSTTSTSSTSSSARSATTCPPTTTASSRSSPSGHLDGLPARPRARLGLRRPHRQPVRSREPAAHGARLPGGRAADDRRAVGDRDQPAHPARREPPPPRGADRAQPGRRGRRPTSSPTACSASARTARRPPRRRCAGSRTCALLDGRSRPAVPAPARPGSGGRHPRSRWLEELLAVAGHDRRGDGPPRAPAPGDDERDGPQRDHEHAAHLVVRLGRVRRERQPRRRGPPRARARSARWTSPRATATATRSRSSPAAQAGPRSRSPARPWRWRTLARRPADDADAAGRGATSATPATT